MTDEWIPRVGKEMRPTDLKPSSPRQEMIYRRIRNILARYMVRGDSKNLDVAALEIWRVTRR